MKLAAARKGESLKISKRELDFSIYPMARTSRRWGLQSTLYASDPWAVIGGAINDSLGGSKLGEASSSFVRQAQEYFSAADRASSIETRPLLYYYSFLNLAKAIAASRGQTGLVGKVSHGINHVGGQGTGHAPNNAKVNITPSSTDPNKAKSAIDELHHALEGRPVNIGHHEIGKILPQSVIGHRMWCSATGQQRRERFVPIDQIKFMDDSTARQVWINLYISRDTVSSLGWTVSKILKESTLDQSFIPVTPSAYDVNSKYHVIEQRVPLPYTHRPGDIVVDAVKGIRPALWQTVTVSPPYRRYYLYLSEDAERMPQWLSIYSTLFWLGSLTRYQPVELFEALNGPYGPFLREFLDAQPKQLLYILASEAKEQNVTKAAII